MYFYEQSTVGACARACVRAFLECFYFFGVTSNGVYVPACVCVTRFFVRCFPYFSWQELSLYSAAILLVGALAKHWWVTAGDDAVESTGGDDGGGGSGSDVVSTGGVLGILRLDLRSLVPVVTNAIGGLLVAQVTFHAGPVKKGFAVVCGILVTAVSQSAVGASWLSCL